MITTVTLNTSIDKAYFMSGTIENGTVMRVSSCKNSAGGKGLNVARTVSLCGEDVLAIGFAGGFNGKYLESLLDQDKIPHCFVKTEGETRSCINILDPTYHSTEYLEPGCEITPEETQKFLETFPLLINDSTVVTISGSVPKGVPKDIYAKMIHIAKSLGKKVFLDTSSEPLKAGLHALPTLIKPNQDELEALFGVTIENFADLLSCGKQLYQTGIPYVLISLGKDGALLICENGVFHGSPPIIDAVNTVGCGDSMLGAFAVAISRAYPPKRALQYAISVATAKAMSTETGSFSPAVAEELFPQITLTDY